MSYGFEMGQKMRVGLDGTVAGTGRKGAGRMSPDRVLCDNGVVQVLDPLLLLLHSNQKLLPKQATPCPVTTAAIDCLL